MNKNSTWFKKFVIKSAFLLGYKLQLHFTYPCELDITKFGLSCIAIIPELPDYSKITFPETDPIPLEYLVPEASEDAVDLFKQFVKYNAEERSTAEAALLHRYFFTKPMAARMEAMPTAAHSGKEADHQVNVFWYPCI